MEKQYKGKKEDLLQSKSQSITDKAKKWVASSLMLGSLVLAGAPNNSYAYTPEERIEYEKNLVEYANYIQALKSNADIIFTGAIYNPSLSEEQKEEIVELKENYLQQSDSLLVSYYNKLKSNPNLIRDKMGISMKVSPLKDAQDKPKVSIFLDNASQLSLEQIEQLEKKYIINKICFHRFFIRDSASDSLSEQYTYSLPTYKMVLNRLDELVGDIKNNPNLNDVDKCIATIKRIQEHIPYDYAAYYGNNQEYMQKAVSTSRNLEGSLLQGTTVCGGYADLLKQALSLCHIEAREILGDQGDQPSLNLLNHAWSQVKLNGKWYNLDLTNMKALEPNSDFAFVLTSDAEFNPTRDKNSSFAMKAYLGNAEKCEQSLSKEEILTSLNKIAPLEQKHTYHKSYFKSVLDKLKSPFQKKEKVLALDASETEKATPSSSPSFRQTLAQKGAFSKIPEVQKKDTSKTSINSKEDNIR